MGLGICEDRKLKRLRSRELTPRLGGTRCEIGAGFFGGSLYGHVLSRMALGKDCTRKRKDTGHSSPKELWLDSVTDSE